MKKRIPSDGQNGRLVHWWVLVHSGPPNPPQTCTLFRGLLDGSWHHCHSFSSLWKANILCYVLTSVHQLDFSLCLGLGSRWDSKEMAEKAHKHMFQLSGFSHIWALLQGWLKVGQVWINTIPRYIHFWTVLSFSQLLGAVHSRLDEY